MDSVDQLRGHVDDATFRRGLYYAEHGAVLTVHRIGADRLSGSVRGNSPKPYDVALRLEVGEGRRVLFSGDCTCPVGEDCKHAVALAIVALRREREDAGSAWESALAPLFDEPTADEQPPLALQFDLKNAEVAGGASIDLRPVVPGKGGAWVRTGVSWTSLTRTYYRWETPGSRESSPRFKAAAQMLGEILAMSGRGAYAPSGAPVRLQDVPTRRIWLLLAEAAREGVPLIGSGRSAPPVRLADPAELGLDISADTGDLLLTPRVTLDGGEIDAEGIRLLGETPHGVAWWNRRGKNPHLTLAPLAGTLDEVVAAVATRGRLRIPEADTSSFTSRYLPRLQRRVAIGSVDRTVTLTPPEPPVLVLRVSHVASGGLRLRWVWRQLGREQTLWPVTPDPHRDSRVEAAVLGTVAEIAKDVAAVFDDDRLRSDVDLFGYDAVRFRSESLPKLEGATGVEVEIDPTIPDYREALSNPLVKATAQPKDDDWYDLAVSVDVDGEKVPFELLFMALAQGRSHLLLPSGTWFPLNTPELSALAILIVESQLLDEPDRKPLTVSRYRPDTWADLVFLGVIDAQAAEWRNRMLALDGPADPAPIPDTVQATLRPYQVDGFRWLVERADRGLGGVLADDMGLGKTLQAITLMCHRQGPGQKFLVVAPTSVVHNWAAELERFAPHLAVTAVEETARRRGTSIAEATAGADVVVTSYALLRLEFEDYAAQSWSVLFLDEAQFVKNRHSQSYDCVKRLPAAVKIAMTGTPMENNLMELWSMFSLVAPGLFPEASHFEHHYGATIARGSEERLVKLRRRIAPFLLRRTKAEVAVELPERQEQVLELRLNAEHHRGYQLLLQRERQKVLKLLADDDGMRKNRLQVLRSLTRLRLAALDLSLVGDSKAPSTKLERLVDLVTEIAGEKHRVLIFSQFTSFLGMARERLEAAGIGCSYLDGSTTGRGEVVERFRSGEMPAFLISLKAGGFGLNLVEADYVILLDPWWNPATEAQAIDRAHRIGQTRTVMVYRLIAEDTIEEKVMALAAKKAKLFDAVLAGGDGMPSTLRAEDIRELLKG